LTSLELLAQGLEFVRAGGSLITVRGPKSAVAIVQTEVGRRQVAMRNPPQLKVPRVGQCEACGDALEPWRGGWCELCSLARRVALRNGGSG
jgi:hypothetical protein